MQFTFPPLEIIVGVLIAAAVRFKSSLTLGFWQAVFTTLISVAAGTGLYEPVSKMVGIDPAYHVATAVVLALCAENLMKAILDFSSKPDALTRIATTVLTRDVSHLRDKIDE